MNHEANLNFKELAAQITTLQQKLLASAAENQQLLQALEQLQKRVQELEVANEHSQRLIDALLTPIPVRIDKAALMAACADGQTIEELIAELEHRLK